MRLLPTGNSKSKIQRWKLRAREWALTVDEAALGAGRRRHLMRIAQASTTRSISSYAPDAAAAQDFTRPFPPPCMEQTARMIQERETSSLYQLSDPRSYGLPQSSEGGLPKGQWSYPLPSGAHSLRRRPWPSCGPTQRWATPSFNRILPIEAGSSSACLQG
jgi:hypothetical protein